MLRSTRFEARIGLSTCSCLVGGRFRVSGHGDRRCALAEIFVGESTRRAAGLREGGPRMKAAEARHHRRVGSQSAKLKRSIQARTERRGRANVHHESDRLSSRRRRRWQRSASRRDRKLPSPDLGAGKARRRTHVAGDLGLYRRASRSARRGGATKSPRSVALLASDAAIARDDDGDRRRRAGGEAFSHERCRQS